MADESPRSSDDRFYTPRASARTGDYSSGEDGSFRTPRTAVTTARSEADYYTPRGDFYDNSSSSDNEEFYSSRDQTADGSFPVMPMPYAHHHRSRSGSSGFGAAGGMPPTHGGPMRPTPSSTRVATFTVPSPRAAPDQSPGGPPGPAFTYPAAGGAPTGASPYAAAKRPSITPLSHGGDASSGGGGGGGGGGGSMYAAASHGGYPQGGGYGGAEGYTSAGYSSGVGTNSYGAPMAAAPAAIAEHKEYSVAAPEGYHVVHPGSGEGSYGGKNSEDYHHHHDFSHGGKSAEAHEHAAAATTTGLSGREIHDVWSLTRHNRYKEVQALLDKGLPVNVRDKYGNTILATACQNGLKRIAKIALRCGADINARNKKGNTPLHFCFAYGYGDSLGEYLISKGADCTIRNNAGLVCREGIERATPRR